MNNLSITYNNDKNIATIRGFKSSADAEEFTVRHRGTTVLPPSEISFSALKVTIISPNEQILNQIVKSMQNIAKQST